MKALIGLLIFIVITSIVIFLHVEKRISLTSAISFLIFGVLSAWIAANHDSISKIKYRDIEIERLKHSVEDLTLKVQQSMQLNQTINTTVQNVTKIEKEIANIKETIHEHYAHYRKEFFNKEKLSKGVVAFPNPVNPDRASIVFFELDNVPESNSIILSNQYGTAPSSTVKVFANIVTLYQEKKSVDVLQGEGEFYDIRYMPDFSYKGELYTVQNTNFKSLENKNWEALHPIRK